MGWRACLYTWADKRKEENVLPISTEIGSTLCYPVIYWTRMPRSEKIFRALSISALSGVRLSRRA